MDTESIGTDMENATPETKYFKMMMADNEIGRVTHNDGMDDSVIGGQTIASLINDVDNARAARKSKNVESNAETNDADPSSNSTMSIVGYDDVSTLANDTDNETTKAFYTGNGDRKDSKPRIRLFKEYKNPYKTPEKKKSNRNQIEDDEETQPETPPGMIRVHSNHNRSTDLSHKTNDEGSRVDEKDNSFFVRSKRVYIVAGVLALILFVSIISLAVALKGVRGKGTTESTSSAITSSSGSTDDKNGMAILDIWPDLDTAITNDDKSSANGMDVPSVKEPVGEDPIAETREPTLLPETSDPIFKPTEDPANQFMFDEVLNLLSDRGAVSSEEIESNPDSPQYYAATWVSQDPNFYGYNQDRIVQRWSLAVLAQSLSSNSAAQNLRRLQNGAVSDLLEGWLTYTDECTWFSSNVEDTPCDNDGMYKTIDLQDMMLGGTLPSELALLSNSLQHIILDGNDLTGSIPKEFEDLTNLVSLRLRRNQLEKNLSIDFGQLRNLDILDLGENNLTGFIPYNILYLDSPTEIYLDYNSLSGNIPWSIGDLDSLTTLALGDNNLSGYVPDSLAELENLEMLTLGNNDMRGDLPGGICQFTGLEVLSVDCALQGCECCTQCATTDAPSSIPTGMPTREITEAPSASPTNMPSSSPKVPTISPTECIDEIVVLDFCFAPFANIGVSFSNCDTRRDDWVGLYRVDDNFDRNSLENPELWTWACGTRNCREAVNQKTIPLNSVHAGSDEWPLEPGIYVAVLARNSAQPYTAFAVSETFVIAEQC